nr:ribonuclease H-like domain-containing protein [Tanacetum cinerariifolium]
MTGNISFLLDYKEINGGYVAFRENPKGGKIIGKGKIKTGKLDFNDVYFIKELKFNLFSVSQICDKKNSVFFTYTECVVLSSDYKLPDANHVLLRVPRENNVYNVDLKNVVPSGDLTCLFAKTTLDEKESNIEPLAEAVNTACYVQNRVLVTKPHNKTPYELLLGGSPSIGFMRPFGCLVTILSTLDPLGKFDEKADEGFCVGYSVNCKAFKVFNRIGPKWLFDIDTLTKSMVYQPVVAGNQPNDNAGIKEIFDAENENYVHVSPSGSDKTANKKHDDKAKRADKGKTHVDSPIGVRDLRAKFKEISLNNTNRVNAINAPVTAARPNPTNITNSFNTASPSVNVVSPNFKIVGKSSFVDPSKYLDDPDWLCWMTLFIHMMKKILMDVKSVILYETIEEEVYVYQPSGFEDPDYLDKVYKVVKAVYGLHQALRAWYETLANYLLENGFQRGKIDQTYVKSASFPIEIEKPLLKDPDGEDMDVLIYRSMIGSLKYLTSSRPDIMFVVCACAQFLITLKVSHLHAINRIFRYLKGSPQQEVVNSKVVD